MPERVQSFKFNSMIYCDMYFDKTKYMLSQNVIHNITTKISILMYISKLNQIKFSIGTLTK